MSQGPDSRSEEPRNHERLESWKAIASYLNRAIRTVQLWEKDEGLPVHRHLHKKRGSVYAYRSELDSWWDQHRLRLDASASRRGLLTRWRWVAAGVALTGLAAGAIPLFVAGPAPYRESLPATTRPVVAILIFENVTRDPSLDWLSTGLAQMFISSLSQSHEVDVVGAERIHSITQLDPHHEDGASLEVMRRVAEGTGANRILVGSFVKEGATWRIDARVHEPARGELLVSEKAEGTGESSLFAMVDSMTRRIEVALHVPRPIDNWQDRELKEITTRSLDAYRYYAEGLRLYLATKPNEALVLFQKAMGEDPEFAMASFRIGHILANRGRLEEAEPYFQRALENLEGVSARERYYMEGMYYSRQGQAHYGRAVEAFQSALQLSPDDDTIRLNLAGTYSELERFQEAIDLVEAIKARGPSHAFVENEYMFDQVAVGEYEKPRRALEEFIRNASEDSERARALVSLAKNYLYWEKYDEAADALRRAVAIRGDVYFASGADVRWLLGISSEDFPLADGAADELSASSDPYLLWLGLSRKAVSELYRGRSRGSLELIEKAVHAYPDGGLNRARILPFAAHILLERGEAERALEMASTARIDGKGDLTEWEGMFFAAIAQAKLGRMEEARQIAEELRRIAESLPTEKETRRYHHLLGEQALAEGDTERAVHELTMAEAMLPPRGYVYYPRGVPEHVPIWFSLARANLAAGRDEEASRWLRKIIQSPAERTDWPILFVRSFFLLGKIHEGRGEREEASRSYRRFVDFWIEGDLDPEQLEEAKSKLRPLDPRSASRSVSDP